jgi:hypothetical protein
MPWLHDPRRGVPKRARKKCCTSLTICPFRTPSLLRLVLERRQNRARYKAQPTAQQKACHSELVEESALEVTAPASAIELLTRWDEPQVPRELRPQVQILRLRFAPLRMTRYFCFAKDKYLPRTSLVLCGCRRIIATRWRDCHVASLLAMTLKFSAAHVVPCSSQRHYNFLSLRRTVLLAMTL